MNHRINQRRAQSVAAGLIAVLALFAVGCTAEDQAKVQAHWDREDAIFAANVAAAKRSNSLSGAQLARLAHCESTGNPRAVSQSGKYHGLYQFDQRTWNGIARSIMPNYVGVRPSAAPAFVQDAMARALYSQRGRSPWPVCGRRI